METGPIASADGIGGLYCDRLNWGPSNGACCERRIGLSMNWEFAKLRFFRTLLVRVSIVGLPGLGREPSNDRPSPGWMLPTDELASPPGVTRSRLEPSKMRMEWFGDLLGFWGGRTFERDLSIARREWEGLVTGMLWGLGGWPLPQSLPPMSVWRTLAQGCPRSRTLSFSVTNELALS